MWCLYHSYSKCLKSILIVSDTCCIVVELGKKLGITIFFNSQKVAQEKGATIDLVKEKEHICHKADTVRLKAVNEFIHTTFGNLSTHVDRFLDLSNSQSPLFDLSDHFIGLKNGNEFELDDDEVQDLENLLKMVSMKIGLSQSHPVIWIILLCESSPIFRSILTTSISQVQ